MTQFYAGDYWITENFDVMKIIKITLDPKYPIKAIWISPHTPLELYGFTKDGKCNYYSKLNENWNLLRKITKETDPEYFI